MYFEILGELSEIERIARGPSVRERARLNKQFGAGRWRKLKGSAGWLMVGYEEWNCIGMKHTELGRRS